jgi:hypothetical protein
MVTGSQAYNLTTNTSDYDYLGVFLAPTTDTLLIHPPHWDWTVSTVPGEDVPDFTFHEAKSIGTYLLKGIVICTQTRRKPIRNGSPFQRKIFVSE